MRITSRLPITIALLVLVAGLTAGCQQAAEEVIEQAAEEAIESETSGDADVEIDDDSVTITSEDGDDSMTMTAGEGAEVPDDYPDDYPLYDGDVIASSSLSSAEGSMVTVSVETKDSFEEVRAYFEEEIAAQGWTVLFQSESTQGGIAVLNFALEKGGRNGSIAISTDEGVTTVVHTVLATE